MALTVSDSSTIDTAGSTLDPLSGSANVWAVVAQGSYVNNPAFQIFLHDAAGSGIDTSTVNLTATRSGVPVDVLIAGSIQPTWSGGVFDLGGGDTEIAITNLVSWGSLEVVTASLTAAALNADAVTASFGFTTGDQDGPFISLFSPASGSTGNPPNAFVTASLSEDQAGVDLSTVVITAHGYLFPTPETVFTGGSYVGGYVGGTDNPNGSNGYDFIFTRGGGWPAGDFVTIDIAASDTAFVPNPINGPPGPNPAPASFKVSGSAGMAFVAYFYDNTSSGSALAAGQSIFQYGKSTSFNNFGLFVAVEELADDLGRPTVLTAHYSTNSGSQVLLYDAGAGGAQAEWTTTEHNGTDDFADTFSFKLLGSAGNTPSLLPGWQPGDTVTLYIVASASSDVQTGSFSVTIDPTYGISMSVDPPDGTTDVGATDPWVGTVTVANPGTSFGFSTQHVDVSLDGGSFNEVYPTPLAGYTVVTAGASPTITVSITPDAGIFAPGTHVSYRVYNGATDFGSNPERGEPGPFSYTVGTGSGPPPTPPNPLCSFDGQRLRLIYPLIRRTSDTDPCFPGIDVRRLKKLYPYKRR